MKYLAGLGLMLCCAQASAFELPLFAKEAREQGYTLPSPYGVSIGAMHVDQDVVIDKIAFSGLKLWGNNIAGDAIDISAAPGSQDSQVFTVRGDVWVLPFLNLYAVGGKMKGTSSTRVTINKVSIIPSLPIPVNRSFDFQLDLNGDLFGAGVVVAGGTGNWFTLVDASLTETRLTVIDGEIDAFVLSPRVGYNFTDMGLPLKVWVGGMYQDVEQDLTGYIHKLDLGPQLGALLSLVDKDRQGRFEVQQHLCTPWNTLVGFQYQFKQDFSLIGEAGLGGRSSAMLSLEYRF